MFDVAWVELQLLVAPLVSKSALPGPAGKKTSLITIVQKSEKPTRRESTRLSVSPCHGRKTLLKTAEHTASKNRTFSTARFRCRLRRGECLSWTLGGSMRYSR